MAPSTKNAAQRWQVKPARAAEAEPEVIEVEVFEMLDTNSDGFISLQDMEPLLAIASNPTRLQLRAAVGATSKITQYPESGFSLREFAAAFREDNCVSIYYQNEAEAEMEPASKTWAPQLRHRSSWASQPAVDTKALRKARTTGDLLTPTSETPRSKGKGKCGPLAAPSSPSSHRQIDGSPNKETPRSKGKGKCGPLAAPTSPSSHRQLFIDGSPKEEKMLSVFELEAGMQAAAACSPPRMSPPRTSDLGFFFNTMPADPAIVQCGSPKYQRDPAIVQCGSPMMPPPGVVMPPAWNQYLFPESPSPTSKDWTGSPFRTGLEASQQQSRKSALAAASAATSGAVPAKSPAKSQGRRTFAEGVAELINSSPSKSPCKELQKQASVTFAEDLESDKAQAGAADCVKSGPSEEKGVRARDEVYTEIRALLESNSALQSTDFDYRIRQHLHALLGSGGRVKLHAALQSVGAATSKKTRVSIKNWPAYIRTLLTIFEGQELAWKDSAKIRSESAISAEDSARLESDKAKEAEQLRAALAEIEALKTQVADAATKDAELLRMKEEQTATKDAELERIKEELAAAKEAHSALESTPAKNRARASTGGMADPFHLDMTDSEDDIEEEDVGDIIPAPPDSACWEWPLSRQEKKARVSLLERQMHAMDRSALITKCKRLSLSSTRNACESDSE